MPKATVIVCIYNRENQIKQCLDSLCELDFKDFELVLVDDGSKDNTLQRLQDFTQANAEMSVRIVSHSINRGLCAARNTGIDAATGEYVFFIDSDCTVHSGWLSAMIRELELSSNAAASGIVHDHPARNYAEEAAGGTTRVDGSRLSRKLIGCNMGFRREVLVRYRFDEALKYYCDEEEIVWRMSQDGHAFSFVPDAIVFHDHPYTVSHYLKTAFRHGQGAARYYYKRGIWIGRDMVILSAALVSLPLVFCDAWFWLVPAALFSLHLAALFINQWAIKKKSIQMAVKVLPLDTVFYFVKCWGVLCTHFLILVGQESAIRRSKSEMIRAKKS